MPQNPQERERALLYAIQDLKNNVFSSERAAARHYGVNRNTLSNRLHGLATRRESRQNLQRLTPEQEEYLVEWVLDLDTGGESPSHQRLREMTSLILLLSGDDQPLGQKWTQGFVKRHLRLKSAVGRRLKSDRAKEVTPEVLDDYFTMVDRVRSRFNIPRERCYNADEQGMGLGVCNNTVVITDSQKTRTNVSSPENREWVTIMECLSADGFALTPLLIFKGRDCQLNWFPPNTPKWKFTSSQKAWIDRDIALHWL
jgi:Tc5 transposase DNA-binding domain/DDE superfamily endonuclease